jgi:hypothetical protein
MTTRPFRPGRTAGDRPVALASGLAAGTVLAVGLAASPATAAVTFAAGAGGSLTVTGIDGDPGAVSAVRVVATETATQTAAGVAGPDDHSFTTTRSFEVAPSAFGSAEATASAVAVSRTIDPASPPEDDPFTGSGLFQLADIEGSGSAIGRGVADLSAEAGAFGAYEITNNWHEPIRVHFDYELGLAALAEIDDPKNEVANATASVEIRRSDASGLVFADVVGAGEDGYATGSFILDVPGYGSGTVTALAEALGAATVVPIPAGAWLLVPGLAVLGWGRRRRAAAAPVRAAAA